MGDGTKNGIILGLDKAAKERDVGLGLKMQRKDSFFSKKMIGMPHHPYHQLRSSSPSGSLSSSGCGGRGGGGGGGGGAFFCNQVAYFSDDSDVVGAAGALPKNLHHYKSETTFNSPVPVSMRIPFTAAQWQELERQTIIYKYILASAPVPPELLFPITKSRSNVHASHPNRLGYSSATDPEPWRCRRTDGKKWRCSRDVIPDQKYCERHIHKNRPRSRKPVESIAEFKKAFPLNLAADNFLKQTNTHIRSPLETMVSASSYDQSRSPTWFLKREMAPVASSNHQWQQLMQPNVGMKRDEFVLQHQEEEVEPVMGNEQGLKNDQCSLILGQKLGTLTERPRDFIDAWSTAERDHRVDNSYNKCSASSNGKLPLSSLTLSMSGVDESNGQRDAQIGLGFMDSDRENGGGGVKCQPLHNWMNPGSWMSSPPGGPLAEALCLGIASRAPSNTESPRGSSSSSKSSRGESSQGFGSIK